MLDPFEQRRAQVLQGLSSQERDKSVAGGVDARIQSLVDCMNQHPDLYTTSSCSGTPSTMTRPFPGSCLRVTKLWQKHNHFLEDSKSSYRHALHLKL